MINMRKCERTSSKPLEIFGELISYFQEQRLGEGDIDRTPFPALSLCDANYHFVQILKCTSAGLAGFCNTPPTTSHSLLTKSKSKSTLQVSISGICLYLWAASMALRSVPSVLAWLAVQEPIPILRLEIAWLW